VKPDHQLVEAQGTNARLDRLAAAGEAPGFVPLVADGHRLELRGEEERRPDRAALVGERELVQHAMRLGLEEAGEVVQFAQAQIRPLQIARRVGRQGERKAVESAAGLRQDALVRIEVQLVVQVRVLDRRRHAAE
jgi:hypothetical protein